MQKKTFGELQEYLKKEINWVMVHFKKDKDIHPGFNNYRSDFSISMRYVEVDCARNCPGIKTVPSL